MYTAGCQTGCTTGWTNSAVRSTRLSNGFWQPVGCLFTRYSRLSNRSDSQLYRVNGVLGDKSFQLHTNWLMYMTVYRGSPRSTVSWWHHSGPCGLTAESSPPCSCQGARCPWAHGCTCWRCRPATRCCKCNTQQQPITDAKFVLCLIWPSSDGVCQTKWFTSVYCCLWHSVNIHCRLRCVLVAIPQMLL